MAVVRDEMGRFVAFDRWGVTWGLGDTADEALADLDDALSDRLACLEAAEGRLSPRLTGQLGLLRRVLG